MSRTWRVSGAAIARTRREYAEFLRKAYAAIKAVQPERDRDQRGHGAHGRQQRHCHARRHVL